MRDQTVAVIDLKSLEASPFLADVGEKERRIGRLILAVLAGAGAGIALGMVVIIIAAVGFVIFKVSGGTPPDQVVPQLQQMIDPKATPTMGGILGLLVALALGNSALLGGFALIAALVQGVRLKSLFTAAPKFRWRMLGLGLAMFVVGIGPL